MKKSQRVWIMGVENRGKEVISYLESLGGKNVFSETGTNANLIYYISHNLLIMSCDYDSEIGRILRDDYKEYILPEYKFKDGDILKDEEYNIFMVFKEFCEPNERGFFSYLSVRRYSCVTNTTLYAVTSSYRLATPSEIEEFYDILQELGYYWDCNNKQLIGFNWKPKYHETYYYITEYNSVCFQNWLDTDIEQIRWRANNCFKTKEEAEVKAKEIKKILKDKLSSVDYDDITTVQNHNIVVKNKWKPSEGETFYSISTSEDCIRKYEYGYDAYTQRLVKNCNCFKTSEEAEKMLNLVNQIFK